MHLGIELWTDFYAYNCSENKELLQASNSREANFPN